MKTVAKAHTRIGTAVVALSMVVAGCGSNSPSAHFAPASVRPIEPAGDSAALVPATARRRDPCNVRADETKVKVGAQMIERGAALVFTTSDDVRRLRERVADPTFSAPLRAVQPRFDNIRGGVRLVFEAETAGDQVLVQRAVREKAGEIAKACGMVLAAEGEWAAEQQREESSSGPTDLLAPSKASQDRSEPREEQKEPEADKSDTPKQPAKADAEPEPAKEPKPEGEPKESDKPKDDEAPKEDENPPDPPLPGPRPDPIEPDRQG